MTHQEIRHHLEKALACCCNLIEGKGHSGGKRNVGFEEFHREGGVHTALTSLAGGKKKSKKGKGVSGGGVSGGKKKKVNKRALIVKKVMKEHGYSMIEASKYVKQQGLY